MATQSNPRRRTDPGWRLAQASFALALVASLVLLLAPLGSSVEPVPTDEEMSSVRMTHESLLQQEGWSVAVPLTIPVWISGAAVLSGRTGWGRPVRTVAAFLLCAFVVVGLFSIGIFYLPAAGAMVGAAVRSKPLEATP
jgi:hypothetical protein